MKRIFLTTVTLFTIFFSVSTYGQSINYLESHATGYFVDGARYAQTSLVGTSRIIGLGGAGSTLGADLTSPALNPAGLGFYRKSEFSFSGGLAYAASKSQYLGQQNKQNRGYFYFPNFGVAISGAKDAVDPGKWRGGTFAISYNRVNNFQNQIYLSGNNSSNTLQESLIQGLNNSNYRSSSALFDINYQNLQNLDELVYAEYLAEFDTTRNLFYNPYDSTPVAYNGYQTSYNKHVTTIPSHQEETILTKGGQNQFDLAYGGNFNDKIYFGASLGVVTVRYLSTKQYYEQPQDSSGNLQNYSFSAIDNTNGVGINFKIGVIVRATDALRFGFNIQTPTAYTFTEKYSYNIQATFAPSYAPFGSALNSQSGSTAPQIYKFKGSTPPIIRAGFTWLAGKRGFITGDVDIIPYNMIKLRDKTDLTTFKYDNQLISNYFGTMANLKLGGELRMDVFRLRGGFGMVGDPLDKLSNGHRTLYTGSLGAGFHFPDFYFDFALSQTRGKQYISPYVLNNGDGPTARVKTYNTGFNMTFGSYF